jgi:hypothetical protein
MHLFATCRCKRAKNANVSFKARQIKWWVTTKYCVTFWSLYELDSHILLIYNDSVCIAVTSWHPKQWVIPNKDARCSPCCLLLAGFLLGLLLNSEDTGDMFLRNVSWFSPDSKALYLRRQNWLSLLEWKLPYFEIRWISLALHYFHVKFTSSRMSFGWMEPLLTKSWKLPKETGTSWTLYLGSDATFIS